MPRTEVKPVSHSGDHVFEEKIAATKQGKLSAEAIFSDEASLFELSKAVLDAYAEWIDTQETMLNSLQPDLQGQAKQNLERCRDAQKRIREGLVYLSDNRDACKRSSWQTLSCAFKGNGQTATIGVIRRR